MEIFCKMRNLIVDLHKELNEKQNEKSKHTLPPQLKKISLKQSAHVLLNFGQKKSKKSENKCSQIVNKRITINIDMKQNKLDMDTINTQFEKDWQEKECNYVKANTCLQIAIEIVADFR